MCCGAMVDRNESTAEVNGDRNFLQPPPPIPSNMVIQGGGVKCDLSMCCVSRVIIRCAGGISVWSVCVYCRYYGIVYIYDTEDDTILMP